MEEKFIMMDPIMKDNLKKIKKMDLENILGQMATNILVNGNKI